MISLSLAQNFLRERTNEKMILLMINYFFGGDEKLCKMHLIFKQYTFCKQQDHIITD